VAGRGPLGREAVAGAFTAAGAAARVRSVLRDRDRTRAASAAAVLVLALVCAWTVWQPLRSDQIGQDAVATLDSGNTNAARVQAQQARDRNPLSVDPLFDLATIEAAAGRKFAARSALEQAVRLQPANPEPWQRLAEFELDILKRPGAALTAIRPALYLDPRSSDAVAVFLAAQRQTKAK
jgi:cytochrome c-type biogenesis protein CcmH/NrfG